ncbi:tripartite motif-containing protein 3-like [Branchiostoma lanceolatum]|uniref:tripartite motif-containing protein 3-like n=1 Tax=Branchiostoma lanceolatum TaxID=7740 RepID=UPI003456021F
MAAGSSSLGEQISEELTCSICLELFTRPKVLPCQHTFCQDCLQDLASRRVPFQCPNCRQVVKLPRQGVAGLPDSHIVANMCNKLQNQAKLSEDPRKQSQSGNRCSFHPSEEVKFYCKQCNMPVCNECLDEMHSDHGTISLKKASRERKAPFQAFINEGRNILEFYCGFLKSLREKEKTLDEEYMKNKEELQEERDRVLADVSELSAACDRAEQEIEQGGGQYLGQEVFLTEVVGKHREKVSSTPVQTQPTDTPAPVLGHVTVPEFVSSAPTSDNVDKAETITFGQEGSEAGQFNHPQGVTVSEEGEIFVADTGNQRIQVFTLQGTFVRQFPTFLPFSLFYKSFLQVYVMFVYPQGVVRDGEGMCPHDVALDGEGNLWVVGNTESAELLVQFDKQGRVLRKFDFVKVCINRLVSVDTWRNHILITQSTEHLAKGFWEVHVFRSDGPPVRTTHMGMKKPSSITVDGDGNILVLVLGADKDCVYMYNEYGRFLFRFEGEGSCYNESVMSHGRFCTDRAGNIFVAKCRGYSVHLLDKQGKVLRRMNTDSYMIEPQAVGMGPQGQLVVTDSFTNTVHIIYPNETPI